MALSGAERQRRAKAHARGEHGLCDPARRCGESTGAGDGAVTSPRGLRTRGLRLWREMTAGASVGPAQLVVLEEACRLADRLDRLDAFLRGEDRDWMRFHSANEDGTVVRVVVDKALSEARQQQVVLKALVAELRQCVAARAAGSSAGGGGVPGGVADLTARIASRRAGAAG